MTACTARMNAVHGAFEATRVVRKIQAHRHVARRPTPLAIHPTQPAMRRTPARAPTITTHSTGPERPVGPFSRRDQARFDAYGEIEHDDFDDLEDDLFDDDLDAPSRGSSALTGAGGTFLRVVVGFLALWCWRIAPTGCAWGVIVAGKLVRSPIFGSPFQWFATSFVVSSVSCVALLALTRKKFGTAMNQPRRSDGVPSHNVGIKAATPTMGGAALVPAGLVCALVFNKFADPTVWALSASTAALCVVGVVDDLAKLRGGTADVGLPPWAKLVCQSAVASVLCVWLASGGAGGSVPNTTVALLVSKFSQSSCLFMWAIRLTCVFFSVGGDVCANRAMVLGVSGVHDRRGEQRRERHGRPRRPRGVHRVLRARRRWYDVPERGSTRAGVVRGVRSRRGLRIFGGEQAPGERVHGGHRVARARGCVGRVDGMRRRRHGPSRVCGVWCFRGRVGFGHLAKSLVPMDEVENRDGR